MQIGITCAVDEDGSFGLLSNGIRQAAFFYQKLFNDNGHRAILLTGHDSPLPTQDLTEYGVNMEDVTSSATGLDLVIVVSRRLSAAERYQHEHDGTKVVRYIGGQFAFTTMESAIGPNKSGAETFDDFMDYDSIWMPAIYAPAYQSWCEVMYRVPVQVVPLVWYPIFMPGVKPNHQAFKFEGVPPNPETDVTAWSIGIFEPNNTVTRTAEFPLLGVYNAMVNQKKHQVGRVVCTNAEKLRTNSHFQALISRLGFYDPMSPRGRLNNPTEIQLRGRESAAWLLKDEVDMLVTHDIENSLTYLWLEALYGGWPLVHCSRRLEGLGYFYPRYDMAACGLQILKAMERHDPKAARARMAGVLPMLCNYEAYEELL